MTKQIILIHGEALTQGSDRTKPFRTEPMNRSYAYFVGLGDKYDVEICISGVPESLSDVPSKGWSYSRSEDIWSTKEVTPNLIYDRFSFPGSSRESDLRKKIKSKNIPCINEGLLERICKDKLVTAALFPQVVIPTTVPLPNETYKSALARIGFSGGSDWSSEHCVSKTRYGSGGEGILRNKLENMQTLSDENTLVQPYFESCAGIGELGITRRHDLRIIIMNGMAVAAEARVAHEKSVDNIFFPKSHNSDSIALDLDRVPARFLDVAHSIDCSLAHIAPRIYSVDMAQGASGNVVVYELNSRPLQIWSEQAAHTLGDSDSLIACRKRQQEATVAALAARAHGRAI